MKAAPAPKLQQYEALHSLNQGFDQVLADLDRLVRLGFRRQIVQHFEVMIEETRAWANFELTGTLHEREEREWARFARLRRQWEKRVRGPNDVMIEAERLRHKR